MDKWKGGWIDRSSDRWVNTWTGGRAGGSLDGRVGLSRKLPFLKPESGNSSSFRNEVLQTATDDGERPK
jgi:hypothetical protein